MGALCSCIVCNQVNDHQICYQFITRKLRVACALSIFSLYLYMALVSQHPLVIYPIDI